MNNNNVDLKIVETSSNEYDWVDICNAWLSGNGVTDEEIVYLARLNIIDMCDEFKSIIRTVVIDFCEQYAEEWIESGNPCCSWGYKLQNGTVLKLHYGGIAGDYWNNSDHYSIAE